ncbi:hypothetical protein [Anaeromicrobium sediminis]|nr:hypothetical protein [Anaeromicrobium sediminis]
MIKRDLGSLEVNRTINRCVFYNMSPHTTHVEVILRLTLKVSL